MLLVMIMEIRSVSRTTVRCVSQGGEAEQRNTEENKWLLWERGGVLKKERQTDSILIGLLWGRRLVRRVPQRRRWPLGQRVRQIGSARRKLAWGGTCGAVGPR